MKRLRQAIFETLFAIVVMLVPLPEGRAYQPSLGFEGIPWQVHFEAAYASSEPIFLIAGRSYGGGWISGTCFYLQRPSGRYIITADHVVENSESILVARVEQTWVPLRVIRQDISTDLAALSPDNELPVQPLQLRTDSAKQGESLAIIGFPIPDVLGAASVTRVSGTVKAYDATPGGISGFWIAAPAGPGNSGGPVLDSAGRVTGIVAYATVDGSTAFAVHGFYILKLLGERAP